MAPTITTYTEFVVRPMSNDLVSIEQVIRTQRTDSAGRRLHSKETVKRSSLGEFTKQQISALVTALVTEVTYIYTFGEDEQP